MYTKIPLTQHPIIWKSDYLTLEEISPKTGTFAFWQIKAPSMK